jgi:crotonobetainyl-CoA:carnitine CoA-transferase CaiB-like acyl-CoA transferase
MIGGRDHNRADYENLHRNKESLTLNMKEPEGLAILHALVRRPTCSSRTTAPT